MYITFMHACRLGSMCVHTHLRTVPGTGSQIAVEQMYVTIINDYYLYIHLSCYTANFHKVGIPIYFCTSCPLQLNK